MVSGQGLRVTEQQHGENPWCGISFVLAGDLLHSGPQPITPIRRALGSGAGPCGEGVA